MPDLTEQVREAAPPCPQCHGRRSEIRERVVVCSFCHGEGYVLTAAAVARALEVWRERYAINRGSNRDATAFTEHGDDIEAAALAALREVPDA